MKITFLGTGTSQGVPVIGCTCPVCQSLDFRDKRLRASLHVEIDGQSIIIDTGPDFRMQVLRENITHLDAVLYTHEHKDHTAGMDDLRSFNFLQQQDMPVYGRKQVLEQLKTEFAYAFSDEKYPGVPQISLNEIQNKPFRVGETEVIPIQGMHLKLPVFGFRLADFTYITDINYISEREKEKIKGSEVVVLNALQKSHHISHYTLSEAVTLMEEIAPKTAYFTHISHKMGLHEQIEHQIPEHMHLAFDGLTLTL